MSMREWERQRAAEREMGYAFTVSTPVVNVYANGTLGVDLSDDTNITLPLGLYHVPHEELAGALVALANHIRSQSC